MKTIKSNLTRRLECLGSKKIGNRLKSSYLGLQSGLT